MAEIVIINPKFEVSFWGLEYALELLGVGANVPVAALPLLAALTPAGHEVVLVDENVEPIDLDRCARADIVGVTGMSVQRFRMREIIEALKERGCFVVVGGPWVSVEEDYFGELADVVFVGEAETTWPRFLEEWALGRHARRYEQAERTDMTTVPLPRHDLLKMRRFALGSVQFSRGCPFTCEFCDIIVTFGRRPRVKSVGQVLAEIDALWRVHGLETVFIVDDNLIGNKKEIKIVLKALQDWQRSNGYPLTFLTEASIDLADDAEMLALMSLANIRVVFVGVETPNEDSLRETRKLQNLRSGGTIVEKIHRIQDAGLEVWSGQIVGFDNDGPDIFERQCTFLDQARIVTAMVGMLSAIPKTPLHARLAKEGRLDLSDRPQTGTNVIPLRLGREELHQGYLEVMQRLYAPDAYFHRMESLYVDGPLGTLEHWPKLRGVAAVKRGAMVVLQGVFLAVRLQAKVEDRGLRRVYRAILAHAVRRRSPRLFQILALKCAMHYHAARLVEEITTGSRPVNTF